MERSRFGPDDRLAKAGILRELNGVTPKTFYAPEVYNVAYEEME